MCSRDLSPQLLRHADGHGGCEGERVNCVLYFRHVDFNHVLYMLGERLPKVHFRAICIIYDNLQVGLWFEIFSYWVFTVNQHFTGSHLQFSERRTWHCKISSCNKSHLVCAPRMIRDNIFNNLSTPHNRGSLPFILPICLFNLLVYLNTTTRVNMLQTQEGRLTANLPRANCCVLSQLRHSAMF